MPFPKKPPNKLDPNTYLFDGHIPGVTEPNKSSDVIAHLQHAISNPVPTEADDHHTSFAKHLLMAIFGIVHPGK